MSNKFKLEDFLKLLKEYDVERLEDVKIEGDLEIEIEGSAIDLSSIAALYSLLNEFRNFFYHTNMALGYLQRISTMLGIPAPFQMPQVQPVVAPAMPTAPEIPSAPELKLPEKLIEAKFEAPKVEYPGYIEEVVLGATKADGGTRDYVVKLGGEKSLAFYIFDKPQPNLPAIAIDVFDRPPSLAKAVKVHYEDVVGSPAEWAKKCVKKFGADMVTIHLVSTDPLLENTPASEAVKVVEDVLQAVKCPIIIGGSGNKDKDPEVLEKAAEVCEGERVMLASATLDMDWARICEAAKKYGHVVLSWTQMDINNQKTLNRYLLKRA
ncbi:MAG: CO dehydrogenase/acetyl-CoA synthase subunit delta, partial [Archaeoglobaceae archaeon]